ncbi:glycosyltransferase family 2 protein [Lichenihabitans psoromatis]|uniref:glycosyltransferase family 2 protein n=1 Tax=Lichenihabitans psoromatis TaxID=2528642 RepID=UPI00103848E0|nr:glycosyltransferase family 2 protein [Lichenihabitans psoromatis]
MIVSALDDLDAAFFDPRRHRDVLAVIASSRLANGRPDQAFAFADRLCRIDPSAALGRLLRFEALRLWRGLDRALADLDRAADLDPTDRGVNRALLRWSLEAGQRKVAAASLLRSLDPDDLALALQALRAAGPMATGVLRSQGDSVVGWVAWSGHDPVQLRVVGGSGMAHDVTISPDVGHKLASAAGAAASIRIGCGPTPVAVDLVRADGVATTILLEQNLARPAVPRGTVGRAGLTRRVARPSVTVVVPVYEDAAATRACLDSLEAQAIVGDLAVIAVDDASPNDAIRQDLDRRASLGALRLIRNPHNLGFARAVNMALSEVEAGDVLLLNADTLLPPDAIRHLRQVAEATDRVGTVTPFSNNGEEASFPLAHRASPLPALDEIAAIDRAARDRNGCGVVDMPNGIGFCLYITRRCLDAVGSLPELYERGYYEDVDFCLQAAEAGLRNLCATGVYVGHAGSLSFGASKRALVMRNLRVLEHRFPDYRAQSAAFAAADPLAVARARIEALLVPVQPVRILAGPTGKSMLVLRRRAAVLQTLGVACLILAWGQGASDATLTMRRSDGGTPQNLRFALGKTDERDAALATMRAMPLDRIEMADPITCPDVVLHALLDRGVPFDLLCGDLEWFAPGSVRPPDSGGDPIVPIPEDDTAVPQARLRLALNAADQVVTVDRLSDAFARRMVGKPILQGFATGTSIGAISPHASEQGLIGVLVPHPSAFVDRMLTTIARRFRALGSRCGLVVLGLAMADLSLMAAANIMVSGPVDDADLDEVIDAYGIGRLFLPDRTGFFGVIDDVAQRTGLPMSYFDWSFGQMPLRDGDLCFDPRRGDETIADELLVWASGRDAALDHAA